MVTPGPERARGRPLTPVLRFASIAVMGRFGVFRSLLSRAAVGVALLWSAAVAAEPPLPIFDAHVHYGESAWNDVPTARAFDMFMKAGVSRALVSSSPDDGTLRLRKADPARIVAILRPYRAGIHQGNWLEDTGLIDYLSARLGQGTYAGIGEFHVLDPTAEASPRLTEVVRLAVRHGIFVHIHSDAGPVKRILADVPAAKVLWAHAGMTEPADVVGAMLDRYPNLWTEVSFRADAISPGGKLDAAWGDLIVRHKDRFLIGSDTYVTERWERYTRLIDRHRDWLKQLPRPIAEAVAYKNAVRLFGDGGQPGLKSAN